jgi:hypothetical protein
MYIDERAPRNRQSLETARQSLETARQSVETAEPKSAKAD